MHGKSSWAVTRYFLNKLKSCHLFAIASVKISEICSFFNAHLTKTENSSGMF